MNWLRKSIMAGSVLATLATTSALPVLADSPKKGKPSSIFESTSSSVNGTLSTIRWVLALSIVLILILLSIRFLAKRTQVQQRGAIELLAAKQIAPSKSVQVIGVQGKRYLIGVGDQITLLADVTQDYLPESEPDLAPAEKIPSFGTLLASALQAAREKYGTNDGERGEDGDS